MSFMWRESLLFAVRISESARKAAAIAAAAEQEALDAENTGILHYIRLFFSQLVLAILVVAFIGTCCK